jgi:hypothetical protein
MPDSIGVVAGADEAGQIPQAPAQTPQAPEQKPGEPVPASTQGEQPTEPAPQAPGFGERGRMRRRARFLRKARELAYRDLGGLVFDLHRFGQRNDQVVLAKLATLGHIDAELRALEAALREIRPVTVLREAGIAACPRCAAIHGSDDRFCPGCGLAFDMSADRPLSTAPVTAPAQVAPTTAPASLAAPATGTTAARAAELSVGRSEAPLEPAAPATPAATPVESAPPVKPTAAPVAARPAFPTLSRPAPSPAPQSAKPDAESPSDDGASASTTTPPSSTPSPSPATDNGEQKQEPDDEPTQILRPPARGA